MIQGNEPFCKRTAILNAARRLLVQRGFQDVVLDDVAREAKVAKGTLFLYFKNKDEIVSAAFADLMDQLGVLLDALLASKKQGGELFEATVRVILEYFDGNKDFMSQFGAGKFPSCGERSCGKLMKKFADNKERTVRILGRCFPRLGSNPEEKGYSAVALFGLCRSAIIDREISGDRKPLISKARLVMNMFRGGINGKP